MVVEWLTTDVNVLIINIKPQKMIVCSSAPDVGYNKTAGVYWIMIKKKQYR